jgi:hypothetical protein
MKNISKILIIALVLTMTLTMGCVENLTPQYKTIERSEPIYKTLMTVELDDIGDGESSHIITNVYNLDKTYTGSDFWGNKNYNVAVHYYSGTTKAQKNYVEINSIEVLDTYQRIVGHRTWTEKVRI